MIKQVSVVGLGKLGSPILASFASRGYSAIGIDVNQAYVDAMAAHRAPVVETGLQDLIDQNKERISATMDWDEVLAKSDVSFIIVPTPSGPDGAFSSEYVLSACQKLGEALKKKEGRHIFVVTSTVMPGSSVHEIMPMLERASGKKVGKDFGYAYGPVLIALGSVIQNFLNPDVVMIGESDPQTGEELEAFYRTLVGEKPLIHRVNPTEVELAKIAINTYVTTKISFANMLGMVAEKLDGVNVDKVTKILGSDSRIGPKYLKAGGSYGGPCFPRDNRAFSRMADVLGVSTYIPQATDATNRRHITSLVEKIEQIMGGRIMPVGIIGAAYKLDTDVIEEGMGLHLASALLEKGIPVVIYDPSAAQTVRKVFGDRVKHAETLESFFADTEISVITNPYKDVATQITSEMAQGKTIIDCWRILPEGGLSGVNVVPWGVSSSSI